MPKLLDEMDCPQILERLEAFADGDLHRDESSAVASHLADCPTCRKEHALALAIRDELRSLPELDMPAAARARVLEQIGEPGRLDRAGEALQTFWLQPRWVGVAAAAALVALVGIALLLRPDTATTPLATDPAVAQATLEARYALALVGSVNRRAGLELRDKVLKTRVVEATKRGLDQSLERALDSVPAAPENHDLRDPDTPRRQT